MYRRHIEKASWLEERLKPQTSHAAREIINPTASETHMGTDKAGHCCLKMVEEMNVTCLKYFFSSNVREHHQTFGTFQESSTSKPDLWLSSYLNSEMKHRVCKLELLSTSLLLPLKQLSRDFHGGDRLYLKTFYFPVVAFEMFFKKVYVIYKQDNGCFVPCFSLL